MDLHLGKTRLMRTIVLTTAGLATAGLLAAAVALLPPGASADSAADLTLAGQGAASNTASSTSTPQSTPTPDSIPVPTGAAEASVAESATPATAEPESTAMPEPADTRAAETATENGVPGDGTLTPRQSWLAQQQLVRECMTAESQLYLYYEWWNPAYDRADNSNPAMPVDLSANEAAAWTFALDGETGGGTDYVWQDAGCWGAIVEQLGRTN